MATPIGSPRVPSTVGSALVTPVAQDAVEPDDSAHAARCASHASLGRSANATLLASPAEDDQSAPLHVPLLPCTAVAMPGTINASTPAADARALPALPAFSASACCAPFCFSSDRSVPSWGPRGCPDPFWFRARRPWSSDYRPGVLQTRAPHLLWSGAGQEWAFAPPYDFWPFGPATRTRCSASCTGPGDALGSEASARIAADIMAIAQGVATTQADLEILRNGVADITECLENKIRDMWDLLRLR